MSNATIVLSCTVMLMAAPSVVRAQAHPLAVTATGASPADLRAWDQQIDQMLRSRDLRVRAVEHDTLLPGRDHERLDQYYRGVRVAGGDVTRQIGATGGTLSVFGLLHTGIAIDVSARLSPDAARQAIASAAGGAFFGSDPELVVLPLSDGYHLAFVGQATTDVEIVDVYVDANSGALIRKYSDYLTDGVIAKGTGTYGDTKKMSVTPMSGTFVADDGLRPAPITTYDMQGNFTRTQQILNVQAAVAPSDIASDADNDWTDGVVVDAHVYGGWYYDYLFKRFGRHSLDGRDLRLAMFAHPVRLADIRSAPASVVGLYYANAFFCSTCGPAGRGAIVFGEGAPLGYFGPFEVKPFSAALDVVAHELTHGVTAATARLNGFQFSEAGALNEAFSDIFGTSTAFFYEPAGSAPLQASYLQGKELTVPSGAFARSLANPLSTNDPDHYTRRNIGGDPHFNSTIVSHAFYLAIEGGTNRTSGLTVQGVGGANREQIEKAFFRALTVLMPSSSTFALTRVATVQAARDLYGAGSAPERAITQAWDAVGVQERTTPTAALLPNPVVGANNLCTATGPNWVLGITASAGTSNLQITQWQLDFFDSSGRSISRDTLNATAFSQFFVSCGPGSSRILAQSDACSAVCVGLGADFRSGSAQVSFTALDDAGRTVSFATPRATLLPPQ
jgi:Zn-dependent metalloprotease